MKSLLAADLFCGAGGFSTALAQVVEPDKVDLLAVNHWQTAIDSHEANHPRWRALPADLFRLSPKSVSGSLDLLMASPTCTYFSRARGGRPLSWDQRWGRMTPTQVERWAKDLRPTRIIVENVPEFKDWGPVCRREKGCFEHGWKGPETGETKRLFCGKALRNRRGQLFRAWVKRLERLGYVVEWRILNAADFGDATTRKRFFLLARRDGLPIVWPEATHAQVPTGELKAWTPARAIIDWKIRGKSIFTRKKPLAAKTLLRIYAGLIRFRWPERFVLKLRRYMQGLGIAIPDAAPARAGSGQGELFGEPAVIVMRQHADARSVNEPIPAVTAGGTHIGLAEPLVMRADCQGGNGENVRGADEPIYTPTTNGGLAVVEPFVLSQGAGGAPRSTDAPLPTFPTEGAHALIAPFYGTGACKSVVEPLGTATTRDRFALVMPVTHGADASRRERTLEEPLPTVTSAPRGELAFVTAAFGEREGQAARNRSIDEPVPTVCAKGRVPLVEGVDDFADIDILFRMLEPHELAAAMGFPPSYRFQGTKGDRTRQIGNAVPVQTAAALVRAILGIATPVRPRRRVARSA